MSNPAIIVDQLGKRYKIGLRENRRALKHRRLSEALTGLLTAPWRRFKTLSEQTTAESEFWALKDISFEVQPGEVVGIIGRNGAGKSTLLKILSRITEPTTGQAIIRGRVGSLLEVGTGFNPELTGRENIYLNGALLGMRKTEIEAKFDAIVAFAGIDKFLDTPVKRYSSGMYVRLAFAVAAHLEPEILIVDEVLAVGDSEFQRKCLGKMKDVAGQGRTVLFVSHNLGAVADLCSRVVHLAHGKIHSDASSQTVIKQYLKRACATGQVETAHDEVEERSGLGPMRIVRVALTDSAGNVSAHMGYLDPLRLEIVIRSDEEREVFVAVGIRDASGRMLLNLHNHDEETRLIVRKGDTRVSVDLAEILLNTGEYYISVQVDDRFATTHDRVGNCLAFEVHALGSRRSKCQGVFRVRSKWHCANEDHLQAHP